MKSEDFLNDNNKPKYGEFIDAIKENLQEMTVAAAIEQAKGDVEISDENSITVLVDFNMETKEYNVIVTEDTDRTFLNVIKKNRENG